MNSGVLVVLNDPSRTQALSAALEGCGLGSTQAAGVESLGRLSGEGPAAAVLDLNAVGAQEAFAQMRQAHPELPVVVLGRRGDVDEVVECLRGGAADYLPGPFDAGKIRQSLERIAVTTRRTDSSGWSANGWSGSERLPSNGNGQVNGHEHANGNGSGHTNGHTNGSGYPNGHTNGNGQANGFRHGAQGIDGTPADGSSSLETEPITADQIRPLAEHERRLILQALELTSWNAQEAAARLGIGRATIYRKIDRFQLRAERT